MEPVSLIPRPTQAIILGTQAILAAIVEERFALRADNRGFRNSNGEFVTKKRGILQAFIGVGAIAVVVQLVPYVATRSFPMIRVQTIGLALLGSVFLVHEIVDTWTASREEQLVLLLGGGLLFVPFGYLGIFVFILWGVVAGLVTQYNLISRFDPPEEEEVSEAISFVQEEPTKVLTVVIVLIVEDSDVTNITKGGGGEDEEVEEEEE